MSTCSFFKVLRVLILIIMFIYPMVVMVVRDKQFSALNDADGHWIFTVDAR